jgi:Mrp family chromosome partitioning ATPase
MKTIGVTNYIVDEKLRVKDIIFPADDTENLSYVFSGIIPPNPSELLLHPRVEELFQSLKKDFDYVIVDNAPIALVADATNIAKYADLFLYVVRADYLNKNALAIPKKLVEEKQVKKLAFILNATKYGFWCLSQLRIRIRIRIRLRPILWERLRRRKEKTIQLKKIGEKNKQTLIR